MAPSFLSSLKARCFLGTSDGSTCNFHLKTGKGAQTCLPVNKATQHKFIEQPIGHGKDHLYVELKRMYWKGVERELIQVITTLREWRSEKYTSVELDEEKDKEELDLIFGYDYFIDQVSERPRQFANDCMQRQLRTLRTETVSSYDDTYTASAEVKQVNASDGALKARASAIKAEHQSTAVKSSVRANLEERARYPMLERRARMLLQSLGWLDIDKLIEHRPPPPEGSKSTTATAPQLAIERLDKYKLPVYNSLNCSICDKPIRGSMFHCDDDQCTDAKGKVIFICQYCFDDGIEHDQCHLVKNYKLCALDTITPEISRQICQCGTIARVGKDGEPRALFPMTEEEEKAHRSTEDSGTVKCGLLCLKEIVAEAKYAGMHQKHDKCSTIVEQRQKDLEDREKEYARLREKRTARETKNQKLDAKYYKKRQKRLRKVIQLPYTRDRGWCLENEMERLQNQLNEDDTTSDIPWFAGSRVNQNSFGDVHMALRVGPLTIENGDQHAQNGVLIIGRNLPSLQADLLFTMVDGDFESGLFLTEDRMLRRQLRRPDFKHYKAIMKQVVGSPFSGASDKELEDKIVDLLITASSEETERSKASDQRTTTHPHLETILSQVKELLASRVEVYLSSIASKLLSLKTILGWNPQINTCQNLCDALLDTNLFDSLVYELNTLNPPSKAPPNPLYVISFVTRPSSPIPHIARTKFDVPNGHLEEYLLSFRYSRPDSDFLDTLAEYWHDWGAFSAPPYRYQDLFPWDCTPAYFGSRPSAAAMCGSCTLAKHVWAFPFDSFSAASMHLTRPRQLYPGRMTDEEWMRNRLTILLAQDVLLTVAVAMAKSEPFHKATAWMDNLYHRERVRLGGIHRAQPHSHAFDRGKWQEYFIAPWAHLTREDKIKTYEARRLERAMLRDVPLKYNSLSRKIECGMPDEIGAVSGGKDSVSTNNTRVGDAPFAGGMAFAMGLMYADKWDGVSDN